MAVLTHQGDNKMRQSYPLRSLGRFTFPHAHIRLKDVFSVLYTYPTDIPTNTVSYLGSTSFGLRRILTTSNMDRSRLFSVCCLILA